MLFGLGFCFRTVAAAGAPASQRIKAAILLMPLNGCPKSDWQSRPKHTNLNMIFAPVYEGKWNVFMLQKYFLLLQNRLSAAPKRALKCLRPVTSLYVSYTLAFQKSLWGKDFACSAFRCDPWLLFFRTSVPALIIRLLSNATFAQKKKIVVYIVCFHNRWFARAYSTSLSAILFLFLRA